MAPYIITNQAYCKIFFHAAKHPHLPVNGVLLGRSASDNVIVEDTIPLLHHWTSLSPMMEIGLDLATGHAQAHGMSVVGYYQASERLDDSALAPVGEKVAEKIRETFKDAVAFVIDGEKIGSGDPALIPYLPQSSSHSWKPYTAQAAFSSGSPFTLQNPDSPSRAISLVRDKNAHLNFGDFDDHLEDVTIDWLRNKASMLPAIYQGTFVHCTHLGELEILKSHVICVNEQGYISNVLLESSAEASIHLQNPNVTTIKLEDGAFFIPTFCDLHLHAPQFLYQGTGLHLPLMKWLDEYAFKSEERLDKDPLLAERVYNKLAHRLADSGTGAVSLFGTLNTETNLILAKAMQHAGVRAFVGKLSMDISSRSTYKEDSASASLSSVKSFIQQIKDFLSQYPPHLRLVEPIITPRFVPTCSNDLLHGLGELAQSQSVRVQSHLAEASEEVEWVRSERQLDDIVVFEQSKLLSSQTIQAHCTFLHTTELEKMATYGSSVAHCPLSNCYFSEKPFPLREALFRGVKVGLGTDIAGGYSVDIMNSMRQAVSVSRMREGLRAIGAGTGDDRQHQDHLPLSINWKEALYLATRGGALAMDLPKVGSFEVGQAFDAQSISIYTADGTGVGAIDIFDSPGGITEELVEKWWCMGDGRNRLSVWVQGRQIR